jgi:hypothetical protein
MFSSQPHRLQHPPSNSTARFFALNFLNMEPEKKDFTVGRMMHKSWAFVLKELEKCVLLCANCHVIIHTKRSKAMLSAAGLE